MTLTRLLQWLGMFNSCHRGTSLTRCRPDQLMLMDDPAFLPDMALPALDFDFSNLELEPSGNSQRSSQSMMSIRQRSGSVISSHSSSIIGINLPSSSTQAGAFQLPHYDPFGGPSVQKPFAGTGRGLFDDEEGILFQDDMMFEFDAEGMIRDIDVNEREARHAGSVFPSGQGRLESDSAASGRVRKEHEDAVAGRVLAILGGEDDLDMINFGDDDIQMLPEAEPFPMMAGGLGGSDRPNPLLAEEEDKVLSEEGSSDTAEAPAKRRKPKAKKIIAMDQSTELRNSDLIVWQKEYLTHMATATALHNQKKEAAQAKRNADAFLVGNGLNGVGQCIGSSKLPSPLAMFSGVSFLSKITGKAIPEPEAKGKKGTKRGSPSEIEEEQSPASKRARQDGPALDFLDEMGRENLDDEVMMHDSSSGMEIGREAPDALTDHPSSAFFPWNVSASVNSYQRGASSSVQGGNIVPGSIGKHLTSASPLIGRGSNIPGELDHFSDQLDDEMVMYGRSDNEESGVARSKRGESLGRGVGSNQAEFEIFGPAAQVDTQTAANSQWVKDALDRESVNFFEYVRNTISEKAGDELGDDDLDQLGSDEVGAKDKFVTFDELFDRKKNSVMVAAQAFYHVLSLATKARVWVEQDLDEVEWEPFGEIRIGVVA
jgi:hypothetical protein